MGDEKDRKRLGLLVREIFGTDQVDELREIARKDRSYDKIFLSNFRYAPSRPHEVSIPGIR